MTLIIDSDMYFGQYVRYHTAQLILKYGLIYTSAQSANDRDQNSLTVNEYVSPNIHFNPVTTISYYSKGIDVSNPTTLILPKYFLKAQNQYLNHVGTATGQIQQPLRARVKNLQFEQNGHQIFRKSYKQANIIVMPQMLAIYMCLDFKFHSKTSSSVRSKSFK